MTFNRIAVRPFFFICLTIVMLAGTDRVTAQSLALSDLPGFDRVTAAREAFNSFRGGGASNFNWSSDKNLLYFSVGDDRQQINLSTGEIAKAVDEAAVPKTDGNTGGRRRSGGVGRAQQRTSITSQDGTLKAEYRDFNIFLQPVDEEGKSTGDPVQITTGGSEKHRFGTACWVYGEELNQQDAMWFSPDSKTLAFYEIDENHMKTYYLTTGNAELYTSLHTEQYPTAGEDNPHVKLHLYDIATTKTVIVDVEGPVDQYIYDIEFSPSGKELLFHRTNRWQNVMDLMAADISTGKTRTIVTEKQETFQNNSPTMQFLEDGERFIWETEKTGWKQFELRHLDGRLLAALTPDADYPAHQVVSVDEETGWFYYSAFSDDNRLNAQLHRSRLDGSTTDDTRLTRGSFLYSAFQIAPDHNSFVASYETTSDPTSTGVFNMGGEEIGTLSAGNIAQFEKQNVTPGEQFSFTSGDGKATIYGQLFFPRDFDPNKKYPLLIDVYGGPHSVGVTNRFTPGNPNCEFGFVIAKIGNRGTMNLGKTFEAATYQQLGILDLDDQADGVRHLTQRPYIDGNRVGIYGHSYGGYMSALALLRYPDLFHVGVSGAPVSDWKNYDTIYTERYMRTPQVNPEGYKAGSCMEHASKLKGKLFILHGLVDDNVHPSNTWQLVEALQAAGKRFDLMIYPNNQHGFSYEQLKWDYFIRHLNPGVPATVE